MTIVERPSHRTATEDAAGTVSPASREAAMARARDLLGSGDFASAQRILEDLVAAHDGRPDVLHLLGVAHREQFRYNTAHGYLRQACVAHPPPVPAQYVLDLAMALTGLSRHEEALPLYDTLIRIGSPSAPISYLRGFTLEGLGRTAEAAEEYETSYRLSLEAGEPYAPVEARLAVILLGRGQVEEGLRLYRASIDRPGSPEGEATFHAIAGTAAACAANGDRFVELLPPAEVVAPAPVYADRPREPGTPAVRPASYVAELRDATVVGGLALAIAADGTAVCDLAEHPRADRWDLRAPGLPYIARDGALVHALPPDAPPLDAAVTLLGPASGNYYHWIVEQLTRLYLVASFPDHAATAVLVDEAVLEVPTLAEALAAVAPERPVVPIEPRRSRLVRRLVAPSPTSWGPPNLRDGLLLERGDSVLAAEPILWLRERVASGGSARRGDRLVFVSRRGGPSRVVNADEVEAVLVGRLGFEAVRPETLSFRRQVEVFGDARVVVGETGAGMTNLLFMHRDARVVCMQSQPWPTSVFADLADVVGVSLTFVTGELASTAYAKTYQTPYRIDPDYLVAAVRAALRD